MAGNLTYLHQPLFRGCAVLRDFDLLLSAGFLVKTYGCQATPETLKTGVLPSPLHPSPMIVLKGYTLSEIYL